MIVAHKDDSVFNCPSCNVQLPPGATVCPSCGVQLP
ncbi:zinc-ribbon domain-containing protein [Candidatus Margulisiibacteriota bacterium]